MHQPTPDGALATALPGPRGSLSEHVFDALRGAAGARPLSGADISDLEDEAVTLFVLQELSFRPLVGVDPAWEEEPTFVALRAVLEHRLERRLRERVGPPTGRRLSEAVRNLLDDVDGPSLSRWMEDDGEIDHLREFVVHRSAYQLKEADPHTFCLPRLSQGSTKAALLEIQSDEYGRNVPGNAHAELFAETMAALDLHPEAGPDLDRLPAVTLATSTLLGMLGRSRRLAGACVAHLAVFEMTSVEPMARYAATVRRLLPDDVATAAARFFDVHVAADGYHEQLAVDELLDGLELEHPDLAADAYFGAAALMVVEQDLTDHLLQAWQEGRSSLRHPLPGSTLNGHGVEAA
jgi:Iron-containing redox enzyme